ncbi:hypothetical protein G7046_g8002 [Stylonectria norvegica]|nr:hypothetical protein G7046_g8002 [Stylonectria norvegica]
MPRIYDDDWNDVPGWKLDLMSELEDVHCGGQVAAFKTYPAFSNPGLAIEGSSPIALPLTEHGINKIKSACTQAPPAVDTPIRYGDRATWLQPGQPPVEPAVRNTWELDHTQFQLVNPQWQNFLTEVVENTAEELDLRRLFAERPKPFIVKLQKLLLYGPGASSKRTYELPGDKSVSLVICLPSEHEGAKVRTSQVMLEQDRVFATAPTSSFDISSMAWYSDVVYEVEKVTSGHRLVLTYSVQQSIYKTSALAIAFQSQSLKKYLVAWQKKALKFKKLAYPLDGEYVKSSSLSLEGLEDSDSSKCRALLKVCNEAGVYLLLAHLTHMKPKSGQGGHQRAWSELDHVYTIDGEEVAMKIPIDNDAVLVSTWEERFVDWSYEDDESTRNCTWYSETVVVLVRKRYIDEFLKPTKDDERRIPSLANKLIAMVDKDLMGKPSDQTTMDAAERLMKRALTVDADTTPLVLDALSVLTATKWALLLDSTRLYDASISYSLSNHHDQAAPATVLASHLKAKYDSDDKAIDLDRWLGALADKSRVGAFYDAYRTYARIMPPSLRPSIITWGDAALVRKIDAQSTWTWQDATFVSEYIRGRHDDPDWTKIQLLQILAAKGTRELLCDALHEIYLNGLASSLEKARAVYQLFFSQAFSRLKLLRSDLASASYCSGKPYTQTPCRLFIRLFKEAYNVGVTGEAMELLDSFCLDAVRLAGDSYDAKSSLGRVEEVLRQLLEVLEECKVSPLPSVKAFYELSLEDIHRSIPDHTPTPGWANQPIRCNKSSAGEPNCPDCEAVNLFLVSKDQQFWSFKAPEARRKHITQCLRGGEFKLETQRHSSPLTLVITKLVSENSIAQSLRRSACCSVIYALRPLRKSKYLRKLLGDALFLELVLPGEDELEEDEQEEDELEEDELEEDEPEEDELEEDELEEVLSEMGSLGENLLEEDVLGEILPGEDVIQDILSEEDLVKEEELVEAVLDEGVPERVIQVKQEQYYTLAGIKREAGEDDLSGISLAGELVLSSPAVVGILLHVQLEPLLHLGCDMSAKANRPPAATGSEGGWRTDLLTCLDAIKSWPQVAAARQYASFTNPGLIINGQPILALPLTQDRVQAIKDASKLSKEGSGTWEIGYEQLQQANPEWDSFLVKVCRDVAGDMGLKDVSVEPSKLVLYGPGSVFDPLVDPTDSAVGTVAFCLPSEHTGGDVQFLSRTGDCVFATASSSPFGLAAAAFYNKAERQCEKLISGYRLMILYRLVHLNETQEVTLEFGAQSEKLKSCLVAWLKKGPFDKSLAYPLENDYKDTTPSLSSMEGRDRIVCQAFNDECSRAGVFLLFARSRPKNTESGSPEAWTSNVIFSSTGKPISFDATIAAETILGCGPDDCKTDGKEPDQKASQPHHSRTVAFLLPKRHLQEYLPNAGPDQPTDDAWLAADNLLAMLDQDIGKNAHSMAYKIGAWGTMTAVLRFHTRLDVSSFGITSKWALKWNEISLYYSIAKLAMMKPGAETAVAEALAFHLQRRFAPSDSIEWDKWLCHLVDVNPPCKFWDAYNATVAAFEANLFQESLMEWAEDVLREKLMAHRTWGSTDCDFIYKVLCTVPEVWTLENFIPLLVRHGPQNLLFELLHRIFVKRKVLEERGARQIYRYLLANEASKSKLMLALQDIGFEDDEDDGEEVPKCAMICQRFVRLLHESCDMGCGREVSEFLAENCASLIDNKEKWYMSACRSRHLSHCLIVRLTYCLKKHKIGIKESIAEFLILASEGISRARPATSITSTGWARDPVNCQSGTPLGEQCDICVDLNRFLKSSTQQTWSIQAQSDRRLHIKTRLWGGLYAFETQENETPYMLTVTKVNPQKLPKRDMFHLVARYRSTLMSKDDLLNEILSVLDPTSVYKTGGSENSRMFESDGTDSDTNASTESTSTSTSSRVIKREVDCDGNSRSRKRPRLTL